MDVIKVPYKRIFSVQVRFNNKNKQGVLVEIWDTKNFYLKIEKLYKINDDGKLIKLDLKEIDKITEFPYLDCFYAGVTSKKYI